MVAASPEVGNGNLLIGCRIQSQRRPVGQPGALQQVQRRSEAEPGHASRRLQHCRHGVQRALDSTDQIPQRAVDQGVIGRFGTIDPTDGGDTSRYSLSFNGHSPLSGLGEPQFDVDAYIIRYSSNLFSNFSFFLDDPGQRRSIPQADRRTVYGLRPTLTWTGKLGSFETTNKIGIQTRYDDIERVALYNTVGREILSTTREDEVKEGSVGVFAENSTQWTPWFRSIAGVRFDHYNFDVDSSIAVNSGKLERHITSPKLESRLRPVDKTEFFVNGGYGFHSNDARGTVITVDPEDAG